MPDKASEIAEALLRAYDIIAQFEKIISDELIDKQNILPMADSFEGLDSALGLIGTALDRLGCADPAPDGNPYRKLAISSLETRNKIAEAYQACELVMANLRSESELVNTIAFLESCLYGLLSRTYGDDSEAQAAIGNILEICDCGLEALDTLETVGDGECDSHYMNPNGQRLHARIDQLRSLFKSFRPRYDPDKNTVDIDMDDGGTTEENA